MKKRLLAILLAAGMTAALTACGSDADTTAEGGSESGTTAETATNAGMVSTKDYNPDDYVTIEDYAGTEVTVDVYTYTDADVEKQFQTEVEYYVDYMDVYDYEVTDKTKVEDGDIVNIDYTGKKDDVAFEGGTATGAHLEIGSGSFIDGFESGLVGHEVGETVMLDLTFPADYDVEELAGAAVTFEVKINSIDTKNMPEITDELIAKLEMGFDTVEAYKEDIRTYLQDSCDESNTTERDNAVWEAVYAKCTVSEPPKELVDDVVATTMENAQMYADYYGMEFSEFVEVYMGMTVEDYQAEAEISGVEAAKEKLAVAALAKQAGIELTEDDINAAAESDSEVYGYESVEQLLEDIGEGAYYDYVLSKRVYEYLAEQVTIKENEPISILAEQEEALEEEAEEIEVEDEATDEEITEEVTEEDAAGFILQ